MKASHGVGVTLPAGVLEGLPHLKDQRCLFFDFGLLVQSAPPGNSSSSNGAASPSSHKEAIVTVITETSLIVATFPRHTRPSRVVSHQSVAGVSREGEQVTVHCTVESDFTMLLSKTDMFVVYMVDLQDRAVGRSLHFAAKDAASPSADSPSQQQQGSSSRPGAQPSATDKLTAASLALKSAEDALSFNDEELLGVLRFGSSSRRTTRPCHEVEEGSDASSVQTLEHTVDEDKDVFDAPDLPQVTVDSTSMHRRLYYFFLQYDRSKLPYIEKMIGQHRGRETQFMRELEAQYGPEPDKRRWETRDQIAHQRLIKFQLTAQLKRAKDELILLEREECVARAALDEVLYEKNAFLLEHRRLKFEKSHHEARRTAKGPVAAALHRIRVTRTMDAGSSNDVFSSRETTDRMFYLVVPYMFFDFVKEQSAKVHGSTTPPLVLVTNETTEKHFSVNWSFLAGWAVDFGPHSVSFQIDATTNRFGFMPSEKFWKLY